MALLHRESFFSCETTSHIVLHALRFKGEHDTGSHRSHRPISLRCTSTLSTSRCEEKETNKFYQFAFKYNTKMVLL